MNTTPDEEEGVDGCDTDSEGYGIAHLVWHGMVAVELEAHVYKVAPVQEHLRRLVLSIYYSLASIVIHIWSQLASPAAFCDRQKL